MFLKAKNQEIQKEKKITIVYIKNRLDNFLKKKKNYYKIFNFKFFFGFCSFMYSKRKGERDEQLQSENNEGAEQLEGNYGRPKQFKL